MLLTFDELRSYISLIDVNVCFGHVKEKNVVNVVYEKL
jgi:hypothetical protein